VKINRQFEVALAFKGVIYGIVAGDC